VNRKIDANTSPSLVLRIRDHSDADAWTEFIDVYSSLIYDFCRSRSLQSSDAADVTQEILLRVAKAIRNFEYDRSKGLFRDWLARIATNEIRRFMTRKSSVNTSSINLDQGSGSLESSWNERFHQYIFSKALERSQSHFTAETWKMFERSWIDKLPVEQVATELGTTIERVYVARNRVLKRLRYEVAILADDNLV
jgi:RNA polymerase sigma-70 factor, ECF subfamily